MEKFDLVIAGAGPGGYNAAVKAAKSGLTVALIEKNKLGGVCLNEGCIPSKTLLYSAKLLEGVKFGEKYGVAADNLRLDLKVVVNRKNKVVRTLTAGVRNALKQAGVVYIEGSCVLKEKNADGFMVSSGDAFFRAKNVIVAAGSSSVIPGIKGIREALDSGFAVTSREMLDITEIPRRLAVVGGGVIGLELASYFNAAGSEVSVIEAADSVGGFIDESISNILLRNYEKKGIVFYLGAMVTEIGGSTVIFDRGGERLSIEADKLLLCVGRMANVSGLGLEKLDVRFDRRGIITDEICETNVKGLYAIGDVNGRMMLAHTAYREGDVVVNNILGIADSVNYDAVPSVIYTNPEVASVGETEASALAKGYNIEVLELSMRFSGRYLAENEGGDGICKLIADKDSRCLLGVHMIGNNSSEVIYGAALMIEQKINIEDLKKIVFPHPTTSEILREGILEL